MSNQKSSNKPDMVHEHRDISGGAIRAGIFGVSDGLVSNSALILGVAGAQLATSEVITAGVAGLLAGAASMAAGEYVSVKGEAELVQRELQIEAESLKNNHAKEVAELESIYRHKGLTTSEASILATAVHRDPDLALEVHAKEELGIDPDHVGNPVAAAVSSFLAFCGGALLPLIPWWFTDGTQAILVSLILAIAAAAIIGAALGALSERSIFKTSLRQVLVAVIACGVTFVVGEQFR